MPSDIDRRNNADVRTPRLRLRNAAIGRKRILGAARYLAVLAMCHSALHSLSRIAAPSLVTGGVVGQSDFNETGTESALRFVAALAYLLIAFAADRLLRVGKRERRTAAIRVGQALPLVYLALFAPMMVPQALFAVILEPRAAFWLGVPILAILGLAVRRKLSVVMMVPLLMLTVDAGFRYFVKGNRGVNETELVRIVSQPHLRPLLLTPTREADALRGVPVLAGYDVQDILVDSEGHYLYAATGSDYADAGTVRMCPLVRFDLRTGEIARIPVSSGLRPMAIDLKRNLLYVGTDYTEATIVAIDLATFRIVGRHPALKLGAMAALELFFLDAKADVLWVFHEWGTVEKWSLAPFRRLGVYPGYGMHEYLYLPARNEMLFQSEGVPPGLMSYTLAERPIFVRKRQFPLSYGLAYDTKVGQVLMTDPFLGLVWFVDPATFALVRSFRATIGAKNIVYDARRDLIYVGNYIRGTFVVYDAGSGTEKASIYVGKRFRRIELENHTGRVFANTSRGIFEVDVGGLIAATARRD
jgi:hypothetical protein